MTGHSTKVLTEFFKLCNWAYDAWRIHRVLFDDNPRKVELRNSAAGNGLVRLSIITQEYLLHQISKLHDPAIQQGQANLSIEYMLRFGGWDAETKKKLETVKARLDEFAAQLKTVRNKVLSHNDLESTLNGSTLGAFPDGEDVEYFRSLQEFVDIIHKATVGGTNLFCEDAANDAAIVSEFLAASLPCLKNN